MTARAVVDLVVPDLGLGERPVFLSVWLVDGGSEVTEGDRLVELVSDGVTIDLSAPASGVLIKTLVAEDEQVMAGQTLARIRQERANTA